MINLKYITNKLKILHEKTASKECYRIVSIESDNDGRHIVTIQLINKAIFFKKKPEEIMADDAMTEQFSSKDIRALTYLGYLNVNAPEYTILAKKHSEELNKMIFALHKRGEKGCLAKTADQIGVNEGILENLNPKEAYMIGYMAATEQCIIELEQKKSAKKQVEASNEMNQSGGDQ